MCVCGRAPAYHFGWYHAYKLKPQFCYERCEFYRILSLSTEKSNFSMTNIIYLSVFFRCKSTKTERSEEDIQRN